MSKVVRPKHVQSLNWYRNLVQLFVLERITSTASGMTRQIKDNSGYVSDTVLEQVSNKLSGVK